MNKFNQDHIGSNFEDFLKEEDLYFYTTNLAKKRTLIWQISKLIEKRLNTLNRSHLQNYNS